MSRKIFEIDKELKAADEEATRIGGEFRDINDRIEGGDRSDGLKERGRRLTIAMGRLEERREQLREEYKSAIHDGLANGTMAVEGGSHGMPDTYRPAAGLKGRQFLRKGESVDAWLKSNGHVGHAEPLNFGRYLKGMVTGNWTNAEAERKAMSVGTATAGGHLVPTPLSGSVIDLARNASRVFQAGATMVPMTSSTLKIARLTGEGAPGWRNENAPITSADLAFDAVTFTARSLNRLVTLSVELFEDADPSSEDIIGQSFAAQVALELDRAALRGSGTAPEPRGVLNTPGITTTAHGANGTAVTNYDFHLDAVGTVRNNNFEPNAMIQAPRTETTLSKLKEATTNAYLKPPAALDGIPRLNTKQVPINLTVGTSTDCTEIYTGQWNMLGIGIRSDFRIEFLRERFADNGQVAFLAWLRADVQAFQPAAFNIDTGVR
jgi:HK97 family phage major capsid protein